MTIFYYFKFQIFQQCGAALFCLIIYHFENIPFFIVIGITTGKSIIAIIGGNSDNSSSIISTSSIFR